MKIKNYLLKSVVFLLAPLCMQSIAQNQSMLLPVTGIYSTGDVNNDFEGCKIINFTNQNNLIMELPKHLFYNGSAFGRPHIENDIENASPSMNEKYLGQHPAYAQAIVHDKDGNLLFFIVDNSRFTCSLRPLFSCYPNLATS